MSALRITILLGAALTLLSAAPADVEADDGCRIAVGRWQSAPAAPCTSPVGLCTAGRMRGLPSGGYEFTMATLMPAGDPTVPTVFFFTGLSEIDTRRGMLVGTDTGTIDLDPMGSGKFVSLITITDGTDRYEGANGTLQIRGSLDFTTGEARGDFRGRICTP